MKFIEQNKDRPFFFYVAHNMPHVPLHVSDKFRGKSERGLYGDVIEEIDWSVGEILRRARRRTASMKTPWCSSRATMARGSATAITPARAEPLREGKGTNWEGGTREPCIMRWPGKIPAGTKSATTCS